MFDPIPLDVRPRLLLDTLDTDKDPGGPGRFIPGIVVAVFIVATFCSFKASRLKLLLASEWEPIAYLGSILLIGIAFRILAAGKAGHARNRL